MNIHFNRCSSVNNSGAGFQVFVGGQNTSSAPMSITYTDCEVSGVGILPLMSPTVPDGFYMNSFGGKGAPGEIKVVRGRVTATNSWGAAVYAHGSNDAKISFEDTIFFHDAVDSKAVDGGYNNSAIIIAALGSKLEGHALGNVHFKGVKVVDGKKRPFLLVDGVHQGVAGVGGDIAITNPKFCKTAKQIAVANVEASVAAELSKNLTISCKTDDGPGLHKPKPPNPLLAQYGGVNHALTKAVTVEANKLEDGSDCKSIAQLQTLLDKSEGSMIYLKRCTFIVDTEAPLPIRLHSNRSLIMDAATTVKTTVTMPPTDPTPPQNVSGYGGVVVISGANIALVGGHIVQDSLTLLCKYGPNATGHPGSCNFGVDVFGGSDVKVRDVTISGTFSNAIRVFNSQGSPAQHVANATVFGAHALAALTQRPVSLINNTLIALANPSVTNRQPRGIWLIVSAGVIVSGNTVVGPWLYGIDMDSQASFCNIIGNTVTDSLYASIFVEMQCTNNVIASNTIRQTTPSLHATCAGIHIDSYLNTVIGNDFGNNGMCVSGLQQGKVYPPALSNTLVDNIGTVVDLGSSGQHGCGNYAAENRLANGSYAKVEDFFSVINAVHNVSFDRSVCINPTSKANDDDNWSLASDAITPTKTDDDGSPLPRYHGPKPPWTYRGYDRFPAVWFGQNRSGLDNASQMDLEAKHQVVGWGWQQNFDSVAKYTSNASTGTGRPCNKTTCLPNGTIYQQETSLAQMASRFAAFREFSRPNPAHQTQATFVYRHMEVAEYYWSIAAAAFHDPSNAEMFLHDPKTQKICWKSNDMTGPFWNFSNPKAMDWFVDQIGGELTREAGINAVFFDETDWLYCGPVFNNCSHSVITAEQYHHKIEMMRRLAVKLNAAGIWPIYSTFNGFKDTPYRACPFPFDEYYKALAGVGWFRFYVGALAAAALAAAALAANANHRNGGSATRRRRVAPEARRRSSRPCTSHHWACL